MPSLHTILRRVFLTMAALVAQQAPAAVQEAPASPQPFSVCHNGGGRFCVVDGDTFWIGGRKVRIADIDTPETHGPRCAAEAALGARAARRLHALLNAEAFSLEPSGRDTDRYGRLLRIVTRDGRSLGAMLVAEGLARPWTGSRQPWCTDNRG